MKLDETVLQRLAEWQPRGRQELTTAEGEWSVTLTAEGVDDVVSRLWAVAARGPAGDFTSVRDRAEAFASRSQEFNLPMRLLEADESLGVVLVRSTPTLKNGQVSYFESRFDTRGEASFCRYTAVHDPATRREQVAFALAHEALGKLVAALTAHA